MGSQFKVVAITFLLMGLQSSVTVDALWCVARSDASSSALQTALDYACGAGADCAPIEASGLCYLPNTIQAHASYAFNSYYQRKANAPGSCDFGGTANVGKTDPSYGSCVYPASPSSAGGTGGTPTGGPPTGGPPGSTTPSLLAPPPPGTTGPLFGGSNGGLTPGLGPNIDTNNSSELSTAKLLISFLCLILVSSICQSI